MPFRTREEYLALCNCDACPLKEMHLYAPVIREFDGTAELAYVTEYPMHSGKVNANDPLSGKPAQLVNATFGRAGMALDDVYVTSALLCQPGKDRKTGKTAKPTAAMLRACRPRLLAQIADHKPVVTLSAGAGATRALLDTSRGLNDMLSAMQYSEELNTWVLPTNHASQVWIDTDLFDAMADDFSRAVNFSQGHIALPPINHEFPYEHIVPDASGIERAAEVIQNMRLGVYGNVLSIDVETDGLNVHYDPLLQVALSNGEQSWVIEADVLTRQDMREDFARLLRSENLTWVMHNMQFDLQYFFHCFGVHWSQWNTADTMCLALGLSEHSAGVGLKYLSRKYFSAPYYEQEIQQYLSPKNPKYSAIPRPVLALYASKDAVYTQRLYDILIGETKREGTYELAVGLLMDAQRMFSDMSYDGVRVDTAYVDRLRKEFLPAIDESIADIQQYARDLGWESWNGGRPPLSPASWVQLGEFLFDFMKLIPPVSPKTKAARRAGKRVPRHTGKEFYEKYPADPMTKKLKWYKLLTKLMNTFVEGTVKELASDGRVHPDFFLDAARTGRISMKNPPIQTIPRKSTSKDMADIRRLYLAAPRPESGDDPNETWVFVGADYKQLEMRVSWHLSGDEEMGKAIMSGDFHTATAAHVLEIPPEQVTEVQRTAMKHVSFGIVYGRTEYGLYNGQLGELGFSLRQCKEYRDGWLDRFPRTREYMGELMHAAQYDGRLTTPFGRVRRWGLITPQNLQHVQNQAINFPGQSIASDMCMSASIRINKRLRELGYGRGLFIVHDSIECEVREQFLEESLAIIYEEMVTPPFETSVPFDVDVEYGFNWGEMKHWKPPVELVERVQKQIDAGRIAA